MALFIRWIRTGGTLVLVGSRGGVRTLVLDAGATPHPARISRRGALPRAAVSHAAPSGAGSRGPTGEFGLRLPRSPSPTTAITAGLPNTPHPNYDTTFTFFRMAGDLFLRALVGLPLRESPKWVASVEWLALLAVLVSILVSEESQGPPQSAVGGHACLRRRHHGESVRGLSGSWWRRWYQWGRRRTAGIPRPHFGAGVGGWHGEQPLGVRIRATQWTAHR